MSVHIEVIGTLRVTRDGQDVTPSQPKLRQLVSLLAVRHATVVRNETIAYELWGETPSAKHIRIVQTYVSQIRKLLGPTCPLRHVQKVGYQLDTQSDGHLDIEQMLRLRVEADRQVRAGDLPAAAEKLRAAVDLCRGHVLADVPLGLVLRGDKARLDGVRTDTLARYLRLQIELGHPEVVREQAARIMCEDSVSEDLFGLVFGAAPVNPVAPAGPACRVPVQIPPDTAPQVGFSLHADKAAVALTRRGDRPAVVAVIGSPGGGTTTFCVRVANRVRDAFFDGSLSADLAVDEPVDALAKFLRALRPDVLVPPGAEQRARLFRRYTKDKRLLVLLDNVHAGHDLSLLTPDATGAMLLACCSDINAQPTSVVRLPRLAEPELLALFTARAGTRAQREPGSARALVRLCSGLPLAAVVLASVVRSRPHWPLARLAQRLAVTDFPLAAGGSDLAASVARSVDLLDSSELTALARLSAYALPDSVTAGWVTRALDIQPAEAQALLDRSVSIRIADWVAAGRYRFDRLYLRAVRELTASRQSAAAFEPPARWNEAATARAR